MKTLGTAACPPYHIAFVIGGTSAEKNLLTVKLASTHYYDSLPTTGNEFDELSVTSSWKNKSWKKRTVSDSVHSSAVNIWLTTYALSVCPATEHPAP